MLENQPKKSRSLFIAGKIMLYSLKCILSAGVGRTGVYIALDNLLNKLDSESIIDVYETVKSLRKERSNMVQNFDQYLTLYEMIALAIRNKFKADESK
jgi:protein tyrosine phosphatase